MKKVDPRSKMAIVAMLSTFAVCFRNIYWLIGLAVISIFLGMLFKVDFKMLFRRAKHLLLAIFMIALLQSIFTKTGKPLVTINNYVLFTDYGLNMAGQFVIRMFIIIASALIISTSSYREVVDGLIKMKIPYEIAFMVSISIRFLPIFRKEFSDRMNALKLRGIKVKWYNYIKKIKIKIYLITPTIVGSIMKSKELAMAMETRGFRAYKTRTMLRDLKLKSYDWVIIVLSILSIIAGLSVYYIYF